MDVFDIRTKVCIILSKPELRERRKERGNARGDATKKALFSRTF